MPLQNRVDPFGALHAIPARGTLMGNRGIFHDTDQRIVKSHTTQGWVTCTLSFNGRKRKLTQPGRYTELFFLDEATSLAAGHRPCGECRRERSAEFKEAWIAAHGGPEDGRTLLQTIDREMHKARIDKRKKVTFDARMRDLPDGAIFALGDVALLVWKGTAHRWSFEGYGPALPLRDEAVAVLTPEPLVGVLRAGFAPEVHPSLAEQA